MVVCQKNKIKCRQERRSGAPCNNQGYEKFFIKLIFQRENKKKKEKRKRRGWGISNRKKSEITNTMRSCNSTMKRAT